MAPEELKGNDYDNTVALACEIDVVKVYKYEGCPNLVMNGGITTTTGPGRTGLS